MNYIKKTLLVFGFGVTVLGGLFVLSYFFLINPVQNVTLRTGIFFDEYGKKLGSCQIKTTLRKLDSGSGTSKIYYYDLSSDSIGYCNVDAIGCAVSLQREPNVCRPASLQTQCDKSLHPVGFGAKARYECVTE
ncbi:MAG: hypothetical protein Q7R65_01275 [bacterium]|nr:hypothetical protein [bacterium]